MMNNNLYFNSHPPIWSVCKACSFRPGQKFELRFLLHSHPSGGEGVSPVQGEAIRRRYIKPEYLPYPMMKQFLESAILRTSARFFTPYPHLTPSPVSAGVLYGRPPTISLMGTCLMDAPLIITTICNWRRNTAMPLQECLTCVCWFLLSLQQVHLYMIVYILYMLQ